MAHGGESGGHPGGEAIPIKVEGADAAAEPALTAEDSGLSSPEATPEVEAFNDAAMFAELVHDIKLSPHKAGEGQTGLEYLESVMKTVVFDAGFGIERHIGDDGRPRYAKRSGLTKDQAETADTVLQAYYDMRRAREKAGDPPVTGAALDIYNDDEEDETSPEPGSAVDSGDDLPVSGGEAKPSKSLDEELEEARLAVEKAAESKPDPSIESEKARLTGLVRDYLTRRLATDIRTEAELHDKLVGGLAHESLEPDLVHFNATTKLFEPGASRTPGLAEVWATELNDALAKLRATPGAPSASEPGADLPRTRAENVTMLRTLKNSEAGQELRTERAKAFAEFQAAKDVVSRLPEDTRVDRDALVAKAREKYESAIAKVRQSNEQAVSGRTESLKQLLDAEMAELLEFISQKEPETFVFNAIPGDESGSVELMSQFSAALGRVEMIEERRDPSAQLGEHKVHRIFSTRDPNVVVVERWDMDRGRIVSLAAVKTAEAGIVRPGESAGSRPLAMIRGAYRELRNSEPKMSRAGWRQYQHDLRESQLQAPHEARVKLATTAEAVRTDYSDSAQRIDFMGSTMTRLGYNTETMRNIQMPRKKSQSLWQAWLDRKAPSAAAKAPARSRRWFRS